MSKMNAVQDKNANVQALNIMFFKTLSVNIAGVY